jgi:hypothetical protein
MLHLNRRTAMIKFNLIMSDKPIIFLSGLLLLCFITPLSAEHNASHSAVKVQTRQWLELQTEGRLASTKSYQMPGPVSEKVYQRYLNSFDYPIPEYFTGDDGDASVLD